MKLKSVKRMYYKAFENEGKVEKGAFTGCQEALYNEQGNLVKETYYHADGTVEAMKDCIYDAHGRLIEENVHGDNVYYYTGNDGCVPNKITYLYDAHGNLIEECHYSYDEENKNGETFYNKDKFAKSMYIYDTKGNLLIKYDKPNYDSEKDFTRKYIYTYDDKGNEIQSEWYWEEELRTISTRLYDEQGNLLELKFQDSDGEISIYSYSYAYNPDTQLTEITKFRDGNKSEISYKDAEGNKVLKYGFDVCGESRGNLSNKKITQSNLEEFCTYNKKGFLSMRWVTIYDDKGYLIEEKKWYYEKYTIKEGDEIPEGDLKESYVCQNTYDENGELIYQVSCEEYFYDEPIKNITITEITREYY